MADILTDRRWVLRSAAGSRWLLDAAQTGTPYRAPLRLNDTGAELFALAQQGAEPERLAALLCGTNPPPDDALREVSDFLAQLRSALSYAATSNEQD